MFSSAGVVFCNKWVGEAHPLRPCEPIADAAECLPPRPAYFRFTFRNRRVVTIEKFIDNVFEYAFAYEYHAKSGRLATVTTTRSNLGVRVDRFADRDSFVTVVTMAGSSRPT